MFEHCTWLLLIESDMLLRLCGRLEGGPEVCGGVCVVYVRCVMCMCHNLPRLAFLVYMISDLGQMVSAAFEAFLHHSFMISLPL